MYTRTRAPETDAGFGKRGVRQRAWRTEVPSVVHGQSPINGSGGLHPQKMAIFCRLYYAMMQSVWVTSFWSENEQMQPTARQRTHRVLTLTVV